MSKLNSLQQPKPDEIHDFDEQIEFLLRCNFDASDAIRDYSDPFLIYRGASDSGSWQFYPWEGLLHFIAFDEDSAIHWMPRAFIDCFEAYSREKILDALEREFPERSGLEEQAAQFAQSFSKNVAELRRTSAICEAFMTTVQAIGPQPTVTEASKVLESAAKESGLCQKLCAELTEIALGAPRSEGLDNMVHRIDITQACLASRLIRAQNTPAPDAADIQRAVIDAVLHQHAKDAILPRTSIRPEQYIDTLARAMAHGAAPMSPRDLTQKFLPPTTLLVAQIEAGAFDPSPRFPDKDPIQQMRGAIGEFIYKNSPSSHELLPVIHAASKHLEKIGLQGQLDLEACQQAYLDEEIPF